MFLVPPQAHKSQEPLQLSKLLDELWGIAYPGIKNCLIGGLETQRLPKKFPLKTHIIAQMKMQR